MVFFSRASKNNVRKAVPALTLLSLLSYRMITVFDQPKSPLLFSGIGLANHLNSSDFWKDIAPKGNATLIDAAPPYINAITNPNDTTFPRLNCPVPNPSRYDHLRAHSLNPSGLREQRKYFFALNLHQNIAVLPRLLGSVIESIRFLGISRCALSIIEGRSDDGTYEVLQMLRVPLEQEGILYYFNTSDTNPHEDEQFRINKLADLRNEVLEPLIATAVSYSRNSTVIFLNDVSLCMEDILELVHQRVHQKADMTCAMDWVGAWNNPSFYDICIARGMTGDGYFNIPPETTSWDNAWDLFWNDPKAAHRYWSNKPFQVFACWNGGTAFAALPILERAIRFRAPWTEKGECRQGEPTIFCKEMWKIGYGKIAVVPTVNMEYSDDAARGIKRWKGYVGSHVTEDGEGEDDMIEWEETPPEQVKCYEGWENQSWRPWDEALG